MCDAAGKAIPGFTRTDADWLWGNDVARTVTWQAKHDLSALGKRPVRLRLIGSSVKVFAFEFAT